MDCLIEAFGEMMPNSSVCHKGSYHKKDGDPSKLVRPEIFLHSGLFESKKSVYDDFVKLGILQKTVSKSAFKKWWLDDYWNVKVIKN